MYPTLTLKGGAWRKEMTDTDIDMVLSLAGFVPQDFRKNWEYVRIEGEDIIFRSLAPYYEWIGTEIEESQKEA